MKTKISKTLFFLLLLMLGIAAVAAVFYKRVDTAFSGVSKFCVVLDAGHGSPDGGAVGANGTQEKDINLDIVLKLQEILENRGFEIILTRSGDSGVFDSSAKTIHEKKISDMNNRRDIINSGKADLFVSIHMNAFGNKNAEGLHIFYSRNHPEAEPLANLMQEKISDITGAKTHEVKIASDTLYLMKNPMPPAILAECGFITNPEEEKRLNDEEYRAKIAFAIADAISEYAEKM